MGWWIALHLTIMTAVKLKSAPKWSITGGAHKQWQSGGHDSISLSSTACFFIKLILIYLGPWAWVLGSSWFSCLNDIFLFPTLTTFLCQFLMGSTQTAQPEVLMWACGLPSAFSLVNCHKCILSNYPSKKCQYLPWGLTTRHVKTSSSIMSASSQTRSRNQSLSLPQANQCVLVRPWLLSYRISN